MATVTAKEAADLQIAINVIGSSVSMLAQDGIDRNVICTALLSVINVTIGEGGGTIDLTGPIRRFYADCIISGRC